MQLHFIIYFILLAREDLQQQEPSNTVLSYLFAQPARMEGTLKNYKSLPMATPSLGC